MSQRHELNHRMIAIKLELQSISECRVVNGDPAEIETALLAEVRKIGARLDNYCSGRGDRR